jgi:hypothetical protein
MGWLESALHMLYQGAARDLSRVYVQNVALTLQWLIVVVALNWEIPGKSAKHISKWVSEDVSRKNSISELSREDPPWTWLVSSNKLGLWMEEEKRKLAHVHTWLFLSRYGFCCHHCPQMSDSDSSAFKCRHALTALQEASSLQLLLGGFGLLNWAGLPLWDSPACGHVTQPHKFPLIALYALNCSVPLRTLADVFPQRFSFQNSPLTFQLLWLRWILSFGSSSQ